jgi:bacteriocin biosynthesis cyclodehydratase domain-containing protein
VLLVLLLHRRGAVTAVPESKPVRPALKPWYRALQREDRLLLQYGEKLVSFEGRAATQLLPALLPLLDGTRTVDEIVETLGLPVRPAVEKALTLLDEQGVLTAGAPEHVHDSARRSAEFLAATDPLGRPAQELLATIEPAAVAVAGSGPLAAEIASTLRRSGIGGLERLPIDGAASHLGRFELAVAVPAGEEVPSLAAWNVSALQVSLPWLQVLPFDGLLAAVGPLYVPGETACYECFKTRRASNVDYGRELLALQEVGVPLPAAAGLELAVAGLAATLALRWIAHRDQFLPGAWYALELGLQPALEAHVLYRVPRCRACSGLERGAQPLPWHKGAAVA